MTAPKEAGVWSGFDFKGYFSPEEVERFIANAGGLRNRLLIYLLWMTGRRISELLALKFKDVDFANTLIIWTLCKPKRRKQLPMTDNMALELRKWKIYKGLTDDDYVFRSSHNFNKPITRQRADQIIKDVAKRIGITEVGENKHKPHCHTFRHSFCVKLAKMIKNPADIRKACDLTGHVNPGIFLNVYLQFNRGDLKELMDETDEELKSPD